MNLIELCERGRVPDTLARLGMRRLIAQRLADEQAGGSEAISRRYRTLVQDLRKSPVAVHTQDANAQHYEVPAEFFRLHLGPRLKYSSCLYGPEVRTLAQAEEAMLALYAERAELHDGQRILDLGCGWGSLSLWLAEKFPRAQIVGLSNSRGQREFIEARAKQRGLHNLRIVTANVADFDPSAPLVPSGAKRVSRDGGALLGAGPAPGEWVFDRVVSIEMFEHMRNYAVLLARIARWLKPDGKLFVHLFAHRLLAYPFEIKDGSDWMSRYFFTGGIMPSENLLLNFQDDLKVEEHWWVSGAHYEKTANHWLAGMDAQKAQILQVFRKAYGEKHAALWVQRWRMFYMAVAELFGYNGGDEWGVAHYRFGRR